MIYPNSTIRKIIAYVEEHPGARRREIAEGIGHSCSDTRVLSNLLGQLRRTGVLERRGGTNYKQSQWYVIRVAVSEEYLEFAAYALNELKKVHHTVRVEHLAMLLEEEYGSQGKHGVR